MASHCSIMAIVTDVCLGKLSLFFIFSSAPWSSLLAWVSLGPSSPPCSSLSACPGVAGSQLASASVQLFFQNLPSVSTAGVLFPAIFEATCFVQQTFLYFSWGFSPQSLMPWGLWKAASHLNRRLMSLESSAPKSVGPLENKVLFRP